MSKSKKNGKSDWDWFEDSPVAMTEENWSETKIIIDGLRNDGITDIRQYAQDNPTFLAGVSSTVHVVNANLAILKIYKALNKKEFLDAFSVLPDPETYNPQTGLSDIFCTLLENFANGVSSVVIEGPDTTMEGSIIHVRTTTAIAAGHEDDWGLVVQTVEDITEKKTPCVKMTNATSLQSRVRTMAIGTGKLMTISFMSHLTCRLSPRSGIWVTAGP